MASRRRATSSDDDETISERKFRRARQEEADLFEIPKEFENNHIDMAPGRAQRRSSLGAPVENYHFGGVEAVPVFARQTSVDGTTFGQHGRAQRRKSLQDYCASSDDDEGFNLKDLDKYLDAETAKVSVKRAMTKIRHVSDVLAASQDVMATLTQAATLTELSASHHASDQVHREGREKKKTKKAKKGQRSRSVDCVPSEDEDDRPGKSVARRGRRASMTAASDTQYVFDNGVKKKSVKKKMKRRASTDGIYATSNDDSEANLEDKPPKKTSRRKKEKSKRKDSDSYSSSSGSDSSDDEKPKKHAKRGSRKKTESRSSTGHKPSSAQSSSNSDETTDSDKKNRKQKRSRKMKRRASTERSRASSSESGTSDSSVPKRRSHKKGTKKHSAEKTSRLKSKKIHGLGVTVQISDSEAEDEENERKKAVKKEARKTEAKEKAEVKEKAEAKAELCQNSNKQLTPEAKEKERLTRIQTRSEAIGQHIAPQLFALWDEDGSGTLDRIEIIDRILDYVRLGKSSTPISVLEVSAVIDEVDQNMDFELDCEEFVKFLAILSERCNIKINEMAPYMIDMIEAENERVRKLEEEEREAKKSKFLKSIKATLRIGKSNNPDNNR